ncbi:MAG: PCYCGC motif-containing (lipo)protein [Chloroflexota bacterium]|jgi:hypothetical protein
MNMISLVMHVSLVSVLLTSLLLTACAIEPEELEFDLHANACTVCVDITLDQMRMIDDGLSAETIREAIDQTYSIYGPPTPMLGN